jgi:hypothetical protein
MLMWRWKGLVPLMRCHPVARRLACRDGRQHRWRGLHERVYPRRSRPTFIFLSGVSWSILRILSAWFSRAFLLHRVLALKRVEQALPQDTIEMTFLLFV